jgi:ClpP protease-like protein
MRSVINQLLADHSGQSIEKIEQDVERDFIYVGSAGQGVRSDRRDHSQTPLGSTTSQIQHEQG